VDVKAAHSGVDGWEIEIAAGFASSLLYGGGCASSTMGPKLLLK